MNGFKAMKFRVNNEEHSRQVQEKLFEMGYRWWGAGPNVSHTGDPFIYTRKDGLLSAGNSESFFREHENTECYLKTSVTIEEAEHEEMTVSQIEKLLGKRIKIVKEEK